MLTILLYIFFYPILYGISLLPFNILYILSDFFYFVGFKLFKYRADLVKKNLILAFPDKNIEEINSIVQQFYHNFFDILFETIKLLTISETEIRKRVSVGEMSAIVNYKKENKSIILATGHVGNWELGAAAYAIEDYHHPKGVYKRITNTFFNNLMIRIRSRFGGELYAMDDTLDKIRENMGNLTAIGLIADQNPSSHNAYWYKFLGRETPVFTGIELFARRFDFPVVYLRFARLGRGKYEMSSELISDKPRDTEKYQITHEYIRLIEQDIYNQPDNWFWTHNRWKRKKEDLERYRTD